MKKGILAVVAALIVALLAAPFGFGFLAQDRVQELLEEINAGGAVRAELVAFERGWLQSTADVTVEVTGDAAQSYMEYQRKAGREPEPLRCTVRNTVHHGPVPLGAANPAPAVAVLESELVEGEGCRRFQERLGLQVTTRFELDGGGRMDVMLPEQQIAGQSGGAVHWRGLQMEVTFDRGFRSVVTSMQAPGLEVSGPEADVRLGELALASDLHKGIEDLGLGDFSLTLASLTVEPKDGVRPATRIDGLAVEGVSTEGADETVSAEVTLRAADIAVGELDLGPATYKLALRNLDAHAVAKINRTVAELRSKNLPPEQVNMMLGATVMGLLPDLLKKGPVFEIVELSMGGEHGRAVGKGRVTIDTSDPAVLQNPLLLKDALVMDVQFDLPESLLVAFAEFGLRKQLSEMGAEYSDEQIQSMAQMGVRQRMAQERVQRLFVFEDGVYRMRMQMEGGRFSLNGRAIDPTALVPQQP